MMKKIINIISLLLLVILAAGASYYMYEVQKNEKALESQVADVNSRLDTANIKISELQRVAKSRSDEIEMEQFNIALATSSTGSNIVGYPISITEGDWTVAVEIYEQEVPVKPVLSLTTSGSILTPPVSKELETQEKVKLTLSKWKSGVLVESYDFDSLSDADTATLLKYLD